MSASSNERNIPWFSPREIKDNTIKTLAIGRENLLRDFIAVVRRRLESPVRSTARAHWLITGPRGAGKSFFLRYVQVRISEEFRNGSVRFVLLPEELPNVDAPHDLLDEIRRMINVEQHHADSGRQSEWQMKNPEESWKTSLKNLLAAFSEPLLIVGIENFAQLLSHAFESDTAISLLRKLMEHEPRILFLATAVNGSFDDNYDKRFYHQFEERKLPKWDGQAHRDYLEIRAKLLNIKPTPKQLARIDAYSRYTGGNPRIAAILAAAILDEQDIIDASSDLNATIDKITPYYLALLGNLPPKSKKLLDALIRGDGGEPCSQTQLAERVKARQSDISQAFRKLWDTGYLHAERSPGQKETRYQVADRLFVQWYRMRYINPGQRSRLAVLADLLVDAIAYKDKLRYVEDFVARDEYDDALTMAQSAARELIKSTGTEKLIDLMEMFPSDEAMRNAKKEALSRAKKYTPSFDAKVSGAALADLVLNSLSLSPVEKLRVLRALPTLSHSKWDALAKVFEDEKQEFAKLTLDPNEKEIIEQLKEQRANAWQSPWMNIISHPHLDNVLHDFKSLPDTNFEITKTAVYAISWLHHFRKNDEQFSKISEHPNPARGPGVPEENRSSWASQVSPAGGMLSIKSTIYKNVSLRNLWRSINKSISHGWGKELLQILSRLLDALPDTVANTQERAILLCYQSEAFNLCERQEQALQSAQKALALIPDPTASPELYWAFKISSGRSSWALGMFNRWSEALEILQAALPRLKKEDKAWHAGQAARYLWRCEDLASAWRWMASQNLEKDDLWYCIGQLGDGVCDTQRVDGAPQAYAAGRQLLTGLIEQANEFAWKGKLPLESAIRHVFISMLDTGLNLRVLQDLAQDLPDLAPEAGELAPLAKTLHCWFGELRNRGAVDKNAPPPDPDWATTVAALNQELSIEARLRLGLTETPHLSGEAASVFVRVLAFIK